ncbi:hypothetical protein NDU88_006959 [Pleurodeles waltl]|uniref:ribonuclease H n=1 Tax=Pleurodeles waltl TaxID=8319 RepID=A0AAV7LQN9_PLEWA|nr:hypothetical protein NDU88_006959 [Pleurodeles waltl]
MVALCNQTQRFWKQAKSNLEASQEVMTEWYDRKTTLVEFSPGDKVWVMEPVEPRALQDRWTGPFEIKERKGEATYLVDLKTPRHPLRVLHHNRLKPHFERSEVSMLLVTDEGMEEESEPLPDLLSVKEGDGSVEGVILSDSLTLTQRGDCYELLEQFSPLFSLTLGLTHLCVQEIDTGDRPPVKNKMYRLSDKVKASIKEEVSKMLTLGVIEKSSSPWASPVVLVPKATAPGAKPELRFCVDYRGLNSVTRTDTHPIPRADELVDRLGTAKFLSTFDLTSGYWQIGLTEGAKERSAFSTPDGHYQFRVMPFGLKNAPLPSNGWLTGWEEHLLNLKEVLHALQQAGLTIKASKCQIGQGSVVYLGHLVGGGKVQPLQAKIETIKAWQPPRTQTEVRAFLGLTGYNRRFIKGYGTIVSPLTELTSKKQPRLVDWTEACQKAFDSLKEAMCTSPVLKAPDYSQEFIVQTDASEHGIGAVLAQLNEEGSDQPVVFISRRLLSRELGWSAIEREAFAVVWALKNLRPYLFGTHFRVQTDHRPLRWLMQMRGENPKLLRWSISLQGMDFTVEHRPGVDHANTDACSAVKNSPHADPERCRSTPQGKDRYNACGASRISTHGPPGQRLQTSKEEIDVTPAVREKIQRTAHRNDAQPDNKPRIPRTDPGKSGDLDLALLETYTVKQLKGFCRVTRVPTQGASRKEDFQVALRAWAEAHLEEDDEEEEPENGPSEDLLPSVGDVTTAIVPPSRPGSSVSEQSLTAEERREEREFQLQMAKLKIEAQQEERRAEREAKEAERDEAAAERAFAENKLLLAHELSLKELEIKARQSESSSNGGSIQTGPAGEQKVRIPKNVVPSFVVGDDR